MRSLRSRDPKKPAVGRTDHFSLTLQGATNIAHKSFTLMSNLPHPVAKLGLGSGDADYNPRLSASTLMDRPLNTPRDDAAPASFEEAQAELDELVRSMETGQMPLDRLLGAYRRGAQLLEFCRSRLEAVEEQVKVLEEGQLKPWTRP